MTWDEWRGSLDGRPTLWVKHLLRRAGRLVDAHKMVAIDDPGCFHTHPAYAIRIILRGGYVEEIEGGAHRMWLPGMVGFVRPSLSHRIAGLRNGRVSYSLWIRFRKRARVELRGDGWQAQRLRATWSSSLAIQHEEPGRLTMTSVPRPSLPSPTKLCRHCGRPEIERGHEYTADGYCNGIG